MNLLSILFGKFWKVVGNIVSLNYYNDILKRKQICKKSNNNNFHHIGKFFRFMIEAVVMMLYIYIIRYFIGVDKLQALICRSD